MVIVLTMVVDNLTVRPLSLQPRRDILHVRVRFPRRRATVVTRLCPYKGMTDRSAASKYIDRAE